MTRRFAVKKALGLERNIVAVSVAMFLLALGENLWKRSLPTPLPWLLASDIFVRTCKGLVDVFLVL